MKISFFLFALFFLDCNNNSDSDRTNNQPQEQTPDMTTEKGIKSNLAGGSYYNNTDVSSYSKKYTFFQDNRFELSVTEKRSSEKSIYKGQFQVKESKYDNTGANLWYVKLIFDTNEWSSNPLFFVLSNGRLIEPVNSYGQAIDNEDSYGLRLKDFYISMALKHNIYHK
ncbi:MAG: hypothetical protein SGI96_20235 [Bacteroidota bacterium]|nr:hypothetical protein [Bacteroidota bacterium]